MTRNILEEYLVSIGFETNGKEYNQVNDKLKQMEASVGKLKDVLTKAITQFVAFEVAATSALAAFINQVVKADMETQIFARRMLTTVENARSLKAVMDAMGVKDLEQLKDIALNPELRKQFLELRELSSGLEPGKDFKHGIQNFRQVGFELQKLQVLVTYFFQYVVGALGKLLEGPLGRLVAMLEQFAKNFKENMAPWANKAARFLQLFMAFTEQFFRIIGGLGKIAFHLAGIGKVKEFLLGVFGVLMAIETALVNTMDAIDRYIQKLPKGIKDNFVKPGVQGGLIGAGVGAAGGAGIGAAAGTAVLPGIGTILGAGLGAIGGAGVGAAGGATGGVIAKAIVGHLPHIAKNREAFRDYAIQLARKYGVPESLLLQQIQHESGFNPNAVSPAGAVGISQFLPGTARSHGVNPSDPYQSIEGQAKWMSELIGKYGIAGGLAAYNAGPGAVQKYGSRLWTSRIARNHKLGRKDDNDIYGETRNYVKGITRDAGINISINISGAGDPKAVANAVVDKISIATRQFQGVYAS